jgi:hypothetical protein
MARANATKTISVTAVCMGSAFVVQVDAGLPEQRISVAPERPDYWPDSPPADRDQGADRADGRWFGFDNPASRGQSVECASQLTTPG